MEEKEKSFKESLITLSNRKNLTVTGVEKVYEATENRVQLRVSGSNFMILGESLALGKLDIDRGQVEIDGNIREMKFNDGGGKSFLKRIFK